MPRKGGELGLFMKQIKENLCQQEQKHNIKTCREWHPLSYMAWEIGGGSDAGKEPNFHMALGSATFPSQPGTEIHPALVHALSKSSLNTGAGAEKSTQDKPTNQQTKT